MKKPCHKADMRLYDKLPREARDALKDCRINWDIRKLPEWVRRSVKVPARRKAHAIRQLDRSPQNWADWMKLAK